MDIFENLCRTCGNECLDLLNIYEVSVKALDKTVFVAEMLSSCLPTGFPALQPTDAYPKLICRICLKKLTLVYEFNQQWVGAHSEFNVALKFEERRKRSLASKSQDLKVPELLKPREVPELPRISPEAGGAKSRSMFSAKGL
ncbi:uncharacterized protein Dlip1 isoform X2 [Drosophila kikkawai]|uniref:Uncharacterized protein Dlip1 isoform X2 n=1 Tax=Drosophila kikkawai TaxID=30033 RepID=A0A6P4HRE0_DROKI|nr:uncharacterized protein LOC108071771 isoform X2 [Drosophila kikkawai]